MNISENNIISVNSEISNIKENTTMNKKSEGCYSPLPQHKIVGFLRR